MAHRNTKPSRRTQKTCKQIADLLLAYINDELSPYRRRSFKAHLRACPDCVRFLRTYKKTIRATGTLYPDEVPAKVLDNVWQFVRRKVRA
jgi:anti-sigma factor RsiW